MNRWILLLLPCVLAMPGCADVDTRESGRAWQRNECLHQPGQSAWRQCDEAMQDQRRPSATPQ